MRAGRIDLDAEASLPIESSPALVVFSRTCAWGGFGGGAAGQANSCAVLDVCAAREFVDDLKICCPRLSSARASRPISTTDVEGFNNEVWTPTGGVTSLDNNHEMWLARLCRVMRFCYLDTLPSRLICMINGLDMNSILGFDLVRCFVLCLGSCGGETMVSRYRRVNWWYHMTVFEECYVTLYFTRPTRQLLEYVGCITI